MKVLSKIGDILTENLKEFFSTIENEYNLPKNILWKKWNEEEKFVKKDKKSDYQVFFSAQRNKMVKDNPNITFGEISKQVSTMWKNMNQQDKIKQKITTTALPLEDLRKEYMKMPIQDLKTRCNEKQITKLRKKDDMVNALVAWEESNQKKQSTIRQEMSKGRSKLELSAEDKEEEEEDFYFHDDEEDNASSSGTACGDDDDPGMSTSDDDIFDDDE